MKIINDNLKDILKQPTTQRKGKILIDEIYYDVFNVEYYADAYNEGNVIGNAIASQLDFELPYIEKFETFKYFDGVWNGTNYEYIDMGTFHVFDEKDEDDFNKHITAFDNLIKFNAPFNDVGGYPKTLFQELQNVCNQAGVNLQNISIANGEFEVVNNQFVNGESLKTVLKAICQISGTYATIKNDELVLQLKNETNEIINKNQHEPVIWKRRTYGINQVIIGVTDVEGEYVLREDKNDIAENGIHKLVINDNPFAFTQNKRDELIDALFNQVRGFGYIPYEMNCEWLSYLDIGDTITIDDVETIVLRINGKSPKSLESSISAPAVIDSSIEYIDNTDTIKNQLIRTERIVDKNNQTIIDVVEQTTEQNQKISQVVQTVEELNSKISDIADITTSAEDTDAKIEINEVNQSEPIRLVIRPIGENISYLYPSDNLYPSDDLFMKIRTIRFHNKTTNEDFDYELPDDLLYYNSENYDEFILDYDAQSCVINKRVGYNADGTTYILDNPETVEYSYPRIILSEGDYELYILSYSQGYIFARLMAKNIYTTQFYTKAEVDSEISQTAQSIDLSVNSKLSNYSTTTQMNSAINLKANEITSSVSETYATKTELDNAETTLNSKITQTANDINVSVSKTYATKTAVNQSVSTLQSNINMTNQSITAEVTRATSAENQIKGSLELKIGKDENDQVVSMLNASANVINLKSNRLIIDSTNFKLTKEGIITANGGTIAGWNISNGLLSKTFGEYNFEIRTDRGATEPALLVYKNSGSNQGYKWYVRPDGYMYAQNAYINGTVEATSGSFSGSIYSGYGSIGGWSISSESLYGYDNSGRTILITPNGVTQRSSGGGQGTRTWFSIITDSTSDKNVKNNIKEINSDNYENFFDNLKPVTFKFNESFDKENYDKTHFGFIAQDILENESDNNIKNLSMVSENGTFLQLDKKEIIALNTWQIQKLKKQVQEQNEIINNLIERIEKLEKESEK